MAISEEEKARIAQHQKEAKADRDKEEARRDALKKAQEAAAKRTPPGSVYSV